jgi:hypothetical protein
MNRDSGVQAVATSPFVDCLPLRDRREPGTAVAGNARCWPLCDGLCQGFLCKVLGLIEVTHVAGRSGDHASRLESPNRLERAARTCVAHLTHDFVVPSFHIQLSRRDSCWSLRRRLNAARILLSTGSLPLREHFPLCRCEPLRPLADRPGSLHYRGTSGVGECPRHTVRPECSVVDFCFHS